MAEGPPVVLRTIDCVMIRVPDLAAGAEFYGRMLGLVPLWADETSVGMALPESGTELVLHTMDLPAGWGVHYLVDDVRAAVPVWSAAGGAVLRPPFEIAAGWCAVLADPYANPLCILDLRKGTRPLTGAEPR